MGQNYLVVFLAEDSDEIIAHANPLSHGQFLKLNEHGYADSPFTRAAERALSAPTRVVWAGQYADPEPGPEPRTNLYARCGSAPVVFELPREPTTGPRYVINHDTGCYVATDAGPANEFGDRAHPMVALTAEGCGRGMGDLPANPAIGSWARHRISVSDTVPEGLRELDYTVRWR